MNFFRKVLCGFSLSASLETGENGSGPRTRGTGVDEEIARNQLSDSVDKTEKTANEVISWGEEREYLRRETTDLLKNLISIKRSEDQ